MDKEKVLKLLRETKKSLEKEWLNGDDITRLSVAIAELEHGEAPASAVNALVSCFKNLDIKTRDDKKEKPQSGEAKLEITNWSVNHYYSCSFDGYGEDEEQATNELKKGILELAEFIEKEKNN